MTIFTWNFILKAGSWIEGKLTGPGSLKFPDGSEYEGDLEDGEPHGHGIMKCGRYVGECSHIFSKLGFWSHFG
jgi:hypothetical protein